MYNTHKGLREVRRLIFVDVWRVSVTPPDFLIYAIYHLHLGILHVGLTHIAPVQRLRKHMIDALAGVDGASLHRHMLTVDMAGSVIAVLEYVDTLWWAGIRERAGWYDLCRCVVNDVAPGIPQDGKPRTDRPLNQKVLRLLKEIKEAEYYRDFARAAHMRTELTTLSQPLDIPMSYGASVVVPNVTPGQKSLIYRQLVRTLQTTHLKAWGK